MTRRRKWRAPNNPTVPARQVWEAVFHEPWPAGWRVRWAGFMRGALGLCKRDSKTILLSHGDAAKRGGEPVETLIHEFIHIRCPKLRHGAEFSNLVREALSRLGLEALHYANKTQEERRYAREEVARRGREAAALLTQKTALRRRWKGAR